MSYDSSYDSINIFTNKYPCDCTCRHELRFVIIAHNVSYDKSSREYFINQSLHNINDIRKHENIVKIYENDIYDEYNDFVEFILRNYTENEAKYVEKILYNCNCCRRHQKNKPHYSLFG